MNIPSAKEAKKLSETNRNSKETKDYYFKLIKEDLNMAIKIGETYISYRRSYDNKPCEADYLFDFYNLYLKDKGYEINQGFTSKYDERETVQVYWSDEPPEELRYY